MLMAEKQQTFGNQHCMKVSSTQAMGEGAPTPKCSKCNELQKLNMSPPSLV